jgi:predicted nucleic acid-binding protein
MILLDTNVISESLKPHGDPAALDWINAQAIETLYLSCITLAELRFGISIMPDGQRKSGLLERLNGRVVPVFAERILPFGIEAADTYAQLRTRARAAGKAIQTADACIAAIAAAHGLMVATRDTAPFLAAGLSVINPWQAARQ